MYYTTLNNIRANDPCHTVWDKLLRNLNKAGPDDDPLSLLTILESNGMNDAIWALRAVSEPACERDARIFAVRCIRQSAQHLLADPRSLNALDVAELYAIGEATDEELKTAEAAAQAARHAVVADAWEAAWEAARDTADSAWEAARDTAQATWATAQVVGDAAEAAAWAAAWVAASGGDVKAAEADFRVMFCSED